MVDKLNPNDDLAVMGSISSQDGRSVLVMQGDGNLVLYRAGGKARWATATHGKAVSQAVMQGDGNFVMYGPGGVYIWDSSTHGHPGAFLVVQNDGNVVIYDPAGNPLWATDTNIICRAVAGFLPSTSGFHFSNATFSSVPLLNIDVLGHKIPIGDASKGLCGGMAFAARDYFEANISIPPDTTAPSSGVLFDYLVRRLFDSFNLFLPPPPAPIPLLKFFDPLPPFGPGPATYAWLMNPDLPDHETVASNVGVAPHGRAWIMIKEVWPKIQADIDCGRLSPVALVTVKTHDLLQMGQNHQVLAYGYCLDGTDLAIKIYDPSHTHDDAVTLSLSIENAQHTTPVAYSDGRDVWCFFQPVHIPMFPPCGVESQSDWRWCHKCQGLFYAGGQSVAGSCPVGGQHEKMVSGNYTLAHDSAAAVGQSDWRWCHKCHGLFFSGGQEHRGSCPAAGQHEKGLSGMYTLGHTPAE